MSDKTIRKSKHAIFRPKRQVLLFFFVLLLSSALMYLDVALQHRP